MNVTTRTSGSDEGFDPAIARPMIEAFLAADRPSNQKLPRVGELKQSKSFKLCSGKTFEIEIRETERAVLIYLFGLIGGAIDMMQLQSLMLPMLRIYEPDPRAQYTIGDQVDYILRMTESGGRTLTAQLTRDAAFAEILGEPSSKGVEPAQEAEPPPMMCIIVRHKDWCPGVHGDGANCVCNPVPELVDKDTWIRSYTDTGKRAADRAAARESDKGKP